MKNLTTIAIVALIYFTSISTASSFESDALYAILMDANSGQIIYDKNANEKIIPSSMTKIMTLYIVFDELKKGSLKLTDKIRVSEKAWRAEGSRSFLPLNKEVSVEDIVRGIVVQSGNDSCIAIAEHMFGTEDSFADHMNYTAKKLGLSNTHFVNASGLPRHDHYSTAADLAILGSKLISDFPEYYKYFQEKEFSINGITQQNRNSLLNIGGIDGIKTGHTDAGGYGIVVSAVRNDLRLVGVVNGLPNAKSRISSAEALMNYGYGAFKQLVLYKAGAIVCSIPVRYGNKSEINGIVNKDVTALVAKSDAKIETIIRHDNFINAPIDEGQEIGRVIIRNDNSELSAPIVAQHSVEQSSMLWKLFQVLKYKIYY